MLLNNLVRSLVYAPALRKKSQLITNVSNHVPRLEITIETETQEIMTDEEIDLGQFLWIVNKPKDFIKIRTRI